MARPSSYTKEKGDAICKLLIEGKSLRQICEAEGAPAPLSTVMNWLATVEESHPFLEQYARARRLQAEMNADRLIQVAEEATDVNKARLLSDNIKWSASKLLPKKYGDRMEIAGETEVTVRIIREPNEPDSPK